jgi:hypothetical protein
MASATGTITPSNPSAKARARRQLDLAVRGWFAATVFGQLLFVAFILLFYYTSVLSSDYAAWNAKPHISGYIEGDTVGNRQFAWHVLAAAVITTCGLLQLVPQIRQNWPALHRWSGRLFLAMALILSIGGLWLVWVRGSYFTVPGAIAISMDGVLILWFAAMAWYTARQRNFAAHRRWALRTFIVASGVWFMRLGYIVWGVTTGGAGIERGLSGPFDLFWAFATHLLPLAVLELYLRAERGTPGAQRAMAGGLWFAALLIFGGSIGTWLLNWWPAITA